MTKKGYSLLTTKQKAEFDALVDGAKTAQSEGKLMFKDIQRELKKRGGDPKSMGPMPTDLTFDVRKALLRVLSEDKDVDNRLKGARKELSDFKNKIRKEYVDIRKEAGFLPQRNIRKKKSLLKADK